MGSAGRAIGPDGKPIKSANKDTQQSQQRGVRGGKMTKDRMGPGGPGPMRGGRFNGGPDMMGGPGMGMRGGPGGPMMGGGPMRGGPGGPGPMMGGPNRGGPMNMGGPGGPMMGGGPRGPMNMGAPGMINGGGPLGMGGPMGGGPGPMQNQQRGSGPDPHGTYGFFGAPGAGAMMGGDRNGSIQPGPTPSAMNVGQGQMNNNGGPQFGGMGMQQQPQQQQQQQQAPQPLMGPPRQIVPEPQQPQQQQPPAVSQQSGTSAVAGVGDVPGFGTNSSIHELFGKMVWRKMEALRDQAVVDRLQNRIMNLIHDAISDQQQQGTTAPTSQAGQPMGPPQQPMMQQQQPQPIMMGGPVNPNAFRTF